MRISSRAQRIEPFYVMEVAKAASALAREVAHTESPMIFLNIGEPDFTAPVLVQEAAAKAVRDGTTHYTQATGLPALRERISDWYLQRFGVKVPASRIVVTAGASAALQLACLALIESGDQILMPDPSYPCNRHFVSAADGTAVLIPATAAERFQLSADKVQAAWGGKTKGVLLASPSNPTGTSIHADELRRIHAVVSGKDRRFDLDHSGGALPSVRTGGTRDVQNLSPSTHHPDHLDRGAVDAHRARHRIVVGDRRQPRCTAAGESSAVGFQLVIHLACADSIARQARCWLRRRDASAFGR